MVIVWMSTGSWLSFKLGMILSYWWALWIGACKAEGVQEHCLGCWCSMWVLMPNYWQLWIIADTIVTVVSRAWNSTAFHCWLDRFELLLIAFISCHWAWPQVPPNPSSLHSCSMIQCLQSFSPLCHPLPHSKLAFLFADYHNGTHQQQPTHPYSSFAIVTCGGGLPASAAVALSIFHLQLHTSKMPLTTELPGTHPSISSKAIGSKPGEPQSVTRCSYTPMP